jgi:putative spermidine/putrescine transport system substrate-binding protein
MINRRHLLKSGAVLGAASILPAGLARPARSQPSRPFTFCSWGGALQETEKKAFIEPFFAKKGTTFAEASPTTYAKIKAQVEANAVEWDLVTVGGQWMYQARDQNLAEPMDYTVIKNDDLAKAWKVEYGVYTRSRGRGPTSGT